MFHHLIVDIAGSHELHDYQDPAPTQLAQEFEEKLRATPEGFQWQINDEDEQERIAIRWTGWAAGVPAVLRSATGLVGGILEIGRDGVAEVSRPFLRANDANDERELRDLSQTVPTRLGLGGGDLPWPVWKAMLTIMELHTPTILTLVNVPLARRHPLDQIERELMAVYFGIRGVRERDPG